jgi:hypothetical protein
MILFTNEQQENPQKQADSVRKSAHVGRRRTPIRAPPVNAFPEHRELR